MVVFFQRHIYFFKFACHIVAYELILGIFHAGAYTWKSAIPFCFVGWQAYKISGYLFTVSLSGMEKIIEWRKSKEDQKYTQILSPFILPLFGVAVLLCFPHGFLFSALGILLASCLFFLLRFAWAWKYFVDFFFTTSLEKQQNALQKLKKVFWSGALENTKNIKYEEKRKLAKSMLQGELDKDMVAKLTGLTLFDIENIEKTIEGH